MYDKPLIDSGDLEMIEEGICESWNPSCEARMGHNKRYKF